MHRLVIDTIGEWLVQDAASRYSGPKHSLRARCRLSGPVESKTLMTRFTRGMT